MLHVFHAIYYLYIKLKSVFASQNSKNNGTEQLFNRMDAGRIWIETWTKLAQFFITLTHLPLNHP